MSKIQPADASIFPQDCLTINESQYHVVVVAEWLRRLTRNQMGYSRTGSNPVHDVVDTFNYTTILTYFVTDYGRPM